MFVCFLKFLSHKRGLESFLKLFELMLRDVGAGERDVHVAAAFPFRKDEWWGRRRRSL